MPNLIYKPRDFPSDKIETTFEVLIPRYFVEAVEGVCSPLTAKSRRADLSKFILHYRAMNGHDRANEWMPRDTRAFVDAMVKSGKFKASTINRHLSSLKSLGAWLHEERGVLQQSPSRGIKELQIEPLKPQAIRDLAFHRLCKAADVLAEKAAEKYSQDKRNRVILWALNGSGLRIEEFLGLRLQQFAHRKFLNVHGKGGRVRDVLLPIDVARMISEYIQHHRVPGSDWLATNRYGQRLSRNSVAEAFNRIAGYANLTLPEGEQIVLRPHLLRHRHAFKARSAKDDTFAIKRLGHAPGGRYIERYTALDDEEESKLLEKM